MIMLITIRDSGVRICLLFMFVPLCCLFVFGRRQHDGESVLQHLRWHYRL